MYVHSKRVLHGMRPSASRSCKDKQLLKLYPNETKSEKKMLACDTEDNSKGKTSLVNFFDGKHHYTFRNTEASVEWLIEYSKKYKKGVEVWFANTQYDIGNLFRETQEFLSFNIIGSRFITGKIYKEKVKFRDIFNVIPGSSVKSLGKMIGLEKIEVAGQFDNPEYCQRDTEIVFWAKLKYENTLKKLNVEMKNTAASTGFAALLNTFSRLQYNSLTEEDHAFMKQGYYGGRTEVFFTNKIKGDVYGYDIVSSYPNVMRSVPIVDTSSKITTRKPKIETREGFCDCIIRAPENKLPYLPIKFDGKLIFPCGEYRGIWTYFELREAQKIGYKISHIYKSVEFKTNYDFQLSEFINKLFEVRKKAKADGDDVLQYACKIIMNASYGKFAMGNEKSQLAAFEEFHKIKGDFTSELFPNNQIIVKRKTNHAPSTNFLTAALITAHARHNLYNYLTKAQEKGRTLLYCDTDSVFFAGPDFDDLGFKTGSLGSLQKEHHRDSAHFILPKTYMLGAGRTDLPAKPIFKCKGVRGELAEQFFTKGYAESLQPLKYVETCRKNFYIKERNKRFGTKEPYIPFNMWVKKPKTMKSKYSKRISFRNGQTEPIELYYDEKTQENKIAE